MAVDYTRHGIQLHGRSESELAALFNAELTRAVRFEPKRSETAEHIIAMHKRHGEVVVRVLQEKVAEHAAKLVEGTLDGAGHSDTADSPSCESERHGVVLHQDGSR